MEEKLIKELITKSLEAKQKAYCVYSKYPVGAALLAKSGNVYTGCNIESVSYTPTVCAERTAFFKAISEGEKSFTAIAVTAGQNDNYPSPCGVCRQVMREFCNPSEFKIILAKNVNDYKVCTLEDLLPNSFGPEFIGTI